MTCKCSKIIAGKRILTLAKGQQERDACFRTSGPTGGRTSAGGMRTQAVQVAALRMPSESSEPLQTHLTGKLVRGLGSMRRRNVLCDLALTCKGVEFTVHKCVLAASSEYFHAMFTNGLEETRAGHVEMHEVEPGALDVLLDIIYGESDIRLAEDQLEPVLSAAHMLQLDSIYEHCCEMLAEKVTCLNYLQVWDLADKYSSIFLQEKLLIFCTKNFRKLVQEVEFLALSPERLAALVSSDDLNITSEDTVLEAVISWAKADRDIRGPLLQSLLARVRFDLVSPETFAAISEREPWLCDSFKVAGKYFDRSSVGRTSLSALIKRKRNPNFRNQKQTEPVLVVFGENHESDVILQCYSFLHEKWSAMRGLPVPMAKMGIVSIRNLVYLVGGFDGNNYLNTTLIYDVTTGRFKCAGNMSCKRADTGVQELDGSIYAVGGFDGNSYLRDVECYDPRNNQWLKAASLRQGRAGVAIASFNGLLFAIGGYDGKAKAERRLMEYYNPATDQWTKIADMDFGMWNAGVDVLDGCLYLVGGYKLSGDGKPKPSSSVMCFTSRDRSWKTINHLPIEAVRASVVAWDDRLYVMTPQGRLFAYDPCTDRWWELSRAPNIKGDLRGSYAAAALAHKPIQPPVPS